MTQTPMSPHRQGCMMFTMGAFVLSLLVISMVLITGGWFIYVFVVALGIFGFVGMHYLLWGRVLDQHFAGEREEEELRQAERDRHDYID